MVFEANPLDVWGKKAALLLLYFTYQVVLRNLGGKSETGASERESGWGKRAAVA